MTNTPTPRVDHFTSPDGLTPERARLGKALMVYHVGIGFLREELASMAEIAKTAKTAEPLEEVNDRLARVVGMLCGNPDPVATIVDKILLVRGEVEMVRGRHRGGPSETGEAWGRDWLTRRLYRWIHYGILWSDPRLLPAFYSDDGEALVFKLATALLNIHDGKVGRGKRAEMHWSEATCALLYFLGLDPPAPDSLRRRANRIEKKKKPGHADPSVSARSSDASSSSQGAATRGKEGGDDETTVHDGPKRGGARAAGTPPRGDGRGKPAAGAVAGRGGSPGAPARSRR